MIKTIDTRNMSREEWLHHRRKAIGGSDAAAIAGLTKYGSPFTVWLDKLGRSQEKEETEAMRIGRDLEDYVAQRFTEATGKKVRRRNAIITNDLYPFAHANIDRDVVGENAILECKTTNVLNLRKFKGGEYPANYYVQVMHYMAVTGAQKAYIAVLVLGDSFHYYEIKRDEEEIHALMEIERVFWDYVVQQKEPPMTGQICDSDILKELYPVSNGKTVELYARAGQMERYLEIKKQIKELETAAEEIANLIKQDLGENERGADGDYTATWKTYSRSSFDTKAFKAAYPDADLTPFYKTSSYRKFDIKN